MTMRAGDTSAEAAQHEWLVTRAGEIAIYGTVILGYFFSLLAAVALRPANWLAFTIINGLYLVAAWWTWQVARAAPPPRRALVAGVATVTLVTLLVGGMAATGIEFDWLLYFATVGLYVSVLPTRPALLATALLYASVLVALGWSHDWRVVSASSLSILAGFGFVSAFSFANRLLLVERTRSRTLLRRLEESNRELGAAHAQLQAHADEVEELTVARERTRMAREIHDTLGHYLTILGIQLETIAKLQERDPARAALEVAEARRVAAQSMQEVRNAVAALRPAGLATLTLPAALTELAGEFERVAGGAVPTLDLDTPLPPLSPDVQLAIYRAAQEALTNIRKHASADKVLVRLRYEDAWLELLVVDNGRGPGAAANGLPGGGFGLIGLRERIALLGGEVAIGPAVPTGCRLAIRVPVPPAAAAPPPLLTAAGRAAP